VAFSTGTITGAAVTGFTAPLYATVVDQSDISSKSFIVNGLVSGTAPGTVTFHTITSPFSTLIRRAARLQALSIKFLNGITGKYTKVPRNPYSIVTRKGVSIQNGQVETMLIRTTIEVPAGAESFDLANVRAGLSAHCGFVFAQADGAATTTSNGIL